MDTQLPVEHKGRACSEFPQGRAELQAPPGLCFPLWPCPRGCGRGDGRSRSLHLRGKHVHEAL